MFVFCSSAPEGALDASWSQHCYSCSSLRCLSYWHLPLLPVLSSAFCLPDTDLIKPLDCISTPALNVCGWACCAWITPPVLFSCNRFTGGQGRNKSESNLYLQFRQRNKYHKENCGPLIETHPFQQNNIYKKNDSSNWPFPNPFPEEQYSLTAESMKGSSLHKVRHFINIFCQKGNK